MLKKCQSSNVKMNMKKNSLSSIWLKNYVCLCIMFVFELNWKNYKYHISLVRHFSSISTSYKKNLILSHTWFNLHRFPFLYMKYSCFILKHAKNCFLNFFFFTLLLNLFFSSLHILSYRNTAPSFYLVV